MRAVARAGEIAGIVWLAVTLAFFALQVMPGDAVLEVLSASGASGEVIAQRRQQMGLDRPALEQYARYLAGLARGDLGVSLLDGRPVAELLAEQSPATVTLAVASLVLAVSAGVPLGMLAASRSIGGRPTRLLLGLLVGVPVLWTGTLLLAWTGYGFDSPSALLAPALVLGLSGAGAIGFVTEGTVAETQGKPWVTAARGRGLQPARIQIHHILRASAGPIISASMLQAGFLLGGVVVTEVLFNRPGLGRLLVSAALAQDTPVVLGVVVWSAFAYGVLRLAADWAARLLDPRLGQTL